MLGTRTSLTPRIDLCSFGEESSDTPDVFVVDLIYFSDTERANLPAREKTPSSWAPRSALIGGHNNDSLNQHGANGTFRTEGHLNRQNCYLTHLHLHLDYEMTTYYPGTESGWH